MVERDTPQFEPIVSRSAAWLRVRWLTHAMWLGAGAALAGLVVVTAASDSLAPRPSARSVPWVGVVIAAIVGSWWARSSVRSIVALLRGTTEVVGVIDHAKELVHSGQRASYKLWHVVIDGREFTFAPSELRGSGAARLRPGQRAVVRLFGPNELVSLAVDTGAAIPLSPKLAPAKLAPTPLTANDIGVVRRWAAWRFLVMLVFVLVFFAMIAAVPGPLGALHAIFGFMLLGCLWPLAGHAKVWRAARMLCEGTATRLVEGELRQTSGMFPDTFLGEHRLGSAASAPRLATKARARVAVLPVADRGRSETLVAVEWVDATP